MIEDKDVSRYTNYFTQKDYHVEQGDRRSFEDTNVSNTRQNQDSENEQGYSTKYSTTKRRKSKELLHITSDEGNVNKQNNEKHQIQNDMTGWTTTLAPRLFHQELSETRSPWKSIYQKERFVNRTTTIPYHKVTLPSSQVKPEKLEEIRLFPSSQTKLHKLEEIKLVSEDKPPDDVVNLFRLEKDNTVVVKTIHSTKDENKINARNESPNEKFDTDSVYVDNVENDNNITNSTKWSPTVNASSPLATRQQWHTALKSILNSVRYVTESSSKNRHGTKKFEDSPELENDLLLPKSLRKPDSGTFNKLNNGNKNINAKWSDQDDQRRLQSLGPLNLKSFATAQFQTGKEYISLIDENVSVLPLTTTTTTIPEPRSTRKPETFTIGGLLLKGKGDFYQTIGRNPKPILVTPPVSPDKRKTSANTKGVKSVTWKTVRPPKELVLNSETERNKESDDGKDYAKEAKGAQHEIVRHEGEHRNVLDSTIQHRQHKKTTDGNKEIARRKTVRRSSLTGKTATNKPTTTLPPQNTAIVQKKASSSNKDIMWGKIYQSLQIIQETVR